MPPSGTTAGEGNPWDNESNLLTAGQIWLTPATTSDSSFLFHSTSQAPTQNISVIEHSGATRNASLDASEQFNFDFHQVQPWPAVPVSEQPRASAGALPVNIGGDWRSSVTSTDSALGNTNTGEDSLGWLAGRQTARRKQPTSSSQTSPTDSGTSRSSLLSTNAAAPRSAPSEHTANHSAHNPSKATSMDSKSLQTPKSAQVISNSKKIPGVSKPNAMTKMYAGIRTLEVDEDGRRGQAGQYTRGASLVSSTSGFSRGEIELSKSEVAGGESPRQSRTRENRGAGKTPGVLRTGQGNDVQNGEFTLPPGKGFTIQIGSELFRLSGVSIMSDG